MTSKETFFCWLFTIIIFFGYHWTRNLVRWVSKKYKNNSAQNKKSDQDAQMKIYQHQADEDKLFKNYFEQLDIKRKEMLKEFEKDPTSFLNKYNKKK